MTSWIQYEERISNVSKLYISQRPYTAEIETESREKTSITIKVKTV